MASLLAVIMVLGTKMMGRMLLCGSRWVYYIIRMFTDIVYYYKEFDNPIVYKIISMVISVAIDIINYIVFPIIAAIVISIIFSGFFLLYLHHKEKKFKNIFIDIEKESKEGITKTKEKIKNVYKDNDFEEDILLSRLNFINSRSNLYTGMRTVFESVYLSLIVSKIATNDIPEYEMIIGVTVAVASSIAVHFVLEELYTTMSYAKNIYLYEYEKNILIEKLKSNINESSV